MSDANDFALDLSRWATATVPRVFVALLQKAAMQCLDGVVMLSPVDTGRLRANWQVGVNVVPGSEQAPEPAPVGAPPSPAQFAEATATLSTVKPGDTIYVANPLEYAPYLEHGTPRMAPRPMVRPTVERVRAQFE